MVDWSVHNMGAYALLYCVGTMDPPICQTLRILLSHISLESYPRNWIIPFRSHVIYCLSNNYADHSILRGLYSPPWVPADSAGFPVESRNSVEFHGISMESIWLEPQPFGFPFPWKFPLFSKEFQWKWLESGSLQEWFPMESVGFHWNSMGKSLIVIVKNSTIVKNQTLAPTIHHVSERKSVLAVALSDC